MLYGESGLGEAHLLHAIGHYVTNYYQGLQCATAIRLASGGSL